ncbi:2-iminobutanoate/2-iminopropanoate deaminase-like isoform X2 [Amphiura filiformis]|uniref:2-iminobutanoate/2-iminopropanoate deaminase-like isoform X2 n=1 Tax=Amphiura filiformis TaxID=82378 RepID=UPI003B224FD3
MAGIVRRIVNTAAAPKAVGPYSQAVAVGNTLYVSGQVGIDPSTGKLVEGVEQQCHQVLKNIGKILEDQGIDYNNVVKTTVLMASMNDYKQINEIYAGYFKAPYPARAAYQVACLPLNCQVEIECIAILGKIIDDTSSGGKL